MMLLATDGRLTSSVLVCASARDAAGGLATHNAPHTHGQAVRANAPRFDLEIICCAILSGPKSTQNRMFIELA
mgnify:CR=1 FL=1